MKQTTQNKLPNGWEIKELGEVFDFKNGINAGKESYGTGVKFINVMEVIYNNFITEDIIPGSVQITDEQKQIYLVRKGDVLFNRTSETANEIGLSATYLGNEEVVFGGFVIRGRPLDKSIDDEFKKYCFRSNIVRNQIIKGGQGAVRTNIGQGDLEKVKLPLPSLQEQKSIAKLLGAWDNAIQKTEKLIVQKEQYKKWLLQKLLNGKEKNENHILGNYIKEVSVRNNGNKVTKVLSVTNSRGFIDQEEQFDRVVASKDVSNYKIVRKGQFAYNPSRVNVGSLDLLRKFDEGILSPMYVVFEPDNKKINTEYLFYLLKTSSFTARIPMFVQGSVRDTLAFDGLCGMKFFIPSLNEQIKIANILQTVDQEISLLKTKAEKLKEQKKGLMQMLLTGKKRLKV